METTTSSSSSSSTSSSSPSPFADPAAPRFRVLSDLHLEFYPDAAALLATIPWNEASDRQTFLLLAGDVGIPIGDSDSKHYLDLLTALAARFRGLFLVSGNHEYYACKERATTMLEVDAAIANMCASLHSESRPVVFLQEGEWTFYSERPASPFSSRAEKGEASSPYHVTQLLGCTLWTPVTASAASRMNDVRRTGFNAAYLRAIHAGQYGWLRKKLGRRGIVVKPASPTPVTTTTVVAPPAANDDNNDVRIVEMADDDLEEAPPAPKRFTVLHADGSLSASLSLSIHDQNQDTEEADLRIVMTHHVPLDPPPSAAALPAEESSSSAEVDVSTAYYADLFRLWTPAVMPHLWVCAHLHAQVNRWRAGCLFRSCCHGYPHMPHQMKDRPTTPMYVHELPAAEAAEHRQEK